MHEELRGKRHDLTTNKGVVDFLSTAINGFLQEALSRQELNTLGYVSGIQLKAIAAVQAETKPADSLSTLLGSGVNVKIEFTPEERKMLLTAGSVDKMAQIIQAVKNDGRIIDVTDAAAIHNVEPVIALPPMENPSRTDAPMPTAVIANAMQAEGIRIDKNEVKQILGTSLGDNRDVDSVEIFGFDEVFGIDTNNTEQAQHEWIDYSVDHESLPGVVNRFKKCTKCGIVNKSRHFPDEVCTGGKF